MLCFNGAHAFGELKIRLVAQFMHKRFVEALRGIKALRTDADAGWLIAVTGS